MRISHPSSESRRFNGLSAEFDMKMRWINFHCGVVRDTPFKLCDDNINCWFIQLSISDYNILIGLIDWSIDWSGKHHHHSKKQDQHAHHQDRKLAAHLMAACDHHKQQDSGVIITDSEVPGSNRLLLSKFLDSGLKYNVCYRMIELNCRGFLNTSFRSA